VIVLTTLRNKNADTESSLNLLHVLLVP